MNTLELKKQDGAFVFYIRRENVESFERFPDNFDDLQCLKNILERNYFQHDPGPWTINLVEDKRVFEDDKFSLAMGRAISYVEYRDMPDYSYTF